jgi:hypothetical protein
VELADRTGADDEDLGADVDARAILSEDDARERLGERAFRSSSPSRTGSNSSPVAHELREPAVASRRPHSTRGNGSAAACHAEVTLSQVTVGSTITLSPGFRLRLLS